MGMLKFSDATVLGLHALIYLAANDDRKISTKEIADIHNASEAHLAKVMQRLVKSGLVHSVRGPGGGFTLGRPSEDISLREVYELFEGKPPMTACLFDQPVCPSQACLFHDLLSEVNELMERYFYAMTINDAVVRTERVVS